MAACLNASLSVELPGDLCSRCSRWESEKKNLAILLTGNPRNPLTPRFLEPVVDGVQQAAGQAGYEVGSYFFNRLANNFYHRLFVTKPWVECLVQQALVNSEGLCGKGPRCWVNSFRLSYHHNIIMEG